MATNGLKRLSSLALLAALGCTAPEGDPPAQANSPAPARDDATTRTGDRAPAEANQATQDGPDEVFHALGTEPFWGITVADGRLDFDEASGERFSVPVESRVDHRGGWTWRTSRIVVRVDVRPCSDGMSLRLYPTEARIDLSEPSRLAGTTWSGCGGYSYDDGLAGSAWQIVLIDEDEVSGDAYRVEFSADRVSGRAGCNRFGGPYRRGEHGAITFGALAATRMACPEPRMTHERRVLEIMSRASNLRYSDPRTLTLGNEEGGIMLRRLD